MATTRSRILVFVLIVIGEALATYAEILGAKNNNPATQPSLQIFFKMFLFITLAGGFLIIGYMFGFKAFKNIWVVGVTSITSILIVEPILSLTIFQQGPPAAQWVALF